MTVLLSSIYQHQMMSVSRCQHINLFKRLHFCNVHSLILDLLKELAGN